MQTPIHTPHCTEERLRGRLLRSENGGALTCAIAFAPNTLLGFHLYLPHSLGTYSATLTVSADGAPALLSLPLTWSGREYGQECYSALLPLSPLAEQASFFTYRIGLETACGTLFVRQRAGAEVELSPVSLRQGEEPCFYIYDPQYNLLDEQLGGTVYVAEAISQHTGAPILEDEGFLSHLSRLGVRALWLTSYQEEGRAQPWRAERILTRTACENARAHGLAIYPDLWLAAGLSGNVTFFFEEAFGALQAEAEEAQVPESCSAAPTAAAQGSGNRSYCDRFCGAGGAVAEWIRAGADGFFVRAADGVGDAFLAAVRDRIDAFGGHALLGALREYRAGDIAFGVRRRFFRGRELDGCVGSSLRTALLGFFVSGETEALRAYLTEEIFRLPAPILHRSLNALSLPGDGFFDALPSVKEREALAALAYLVAATLPGCPAIFSGDEWGAGEGNAANSLYAFYQRVTKMRAREEVYREGGFRLLYLSDDILVFSREREGEALLTVINRADAPLFLTGDFTVLLGGRGRKMQFTLPPFSGTVCRISLWAGEENRLRLSRELPDFSTAQSSEEETQILHFATHGVL